MSARLPALRARASISRSTGVSSGAPPASAVTRVITDAGFSGSL
ncbi:hypothetical protein AB6B38_07410 [Glycocaulis abyssi]|uniref:Uncharacterized protein n=1 Tax=Glycocaulis abyssi TaxID=1433403 RepID=A0ABV9N868_9PROT